MYITITCDKCKNTHTMRAPAKKYLQLRDNLEQGGFSYGERAEISDGKLKEFLIRCKCGNYIQLGMD